MFQKIRLSVMMTLFPSFPNWKKVINYKLLLIIGTTHFPLACFQKETLAFFFQKSQNGKKNRVLQISWMYTMQPWTKYCRQIYKNEVM